MAWTRTHAAREGYMAADEQLVGHALVSAEEAKRAVSVLEAKQGGTDHLLQALQAQVTQLANRVEASEEALRAERARGMERLHDQVERLREKAETSEAALRKRVDELVQRLEAQAKASERALRDNAQRSEQSLRTYAAQLRAQADATEGMLREEIARLRLAAASSIASATPNRSATNFLQCALWKTIQIAWSTLISEGT